MAKVKSTTLTFALTLPQPKGLTIPATRQFIIDALRAEQKASNADDPIKDADLSNVKCHLTNKEVHYG